MIGKNVLIQLILTICSSIVGFISLSLSARFFGPFILGHLAYVLGIMGLIFAFSDLGFSLAHIHFTAALNSAKKTLATFLGLKTILLFLTSLATLIFAAVNPTQFKGVFLIMLASELLSRQAEAILITFEGLQQSWPQNLVRFFAKLIRLVFIIILGYQLSNILGFSLTYLSESVALVVLSLWLIRKILRFNFSVSLAKKYWQYSLPLFAIVPITYLQANLLIVLLKYFHSATDVGFYSATFNIAAYLKTLYATIMVFFFPKISSLFHKNDVASVQNYANLTLKYLLIIFTPLFMLGFWFRTEVIQLVLGVNFLAATSTFSWLLLGMFILMLINPYDYILYAAKKHTLLVKVNILSLLLSLVLSWYFMSYLNWKSSGAAIVNVIIWSFSAVYTMYLVNKNLNLKIYSKLLHFIIPAIILLCLGQYLQAMFSISLMLKIFISLTLIALYAVYLFIRRLIKMKDINYFINLLKFTHT